MKKTKFTESQIILKLSKKTKLVDQ